jgi:hypothetical protein
MACKWWFCLTLGKSEVVCLQRAMQQAKQVTNFCFLLVRHRPQHSLLMGMFT